MTRSWPTRETRIGAVLLSLLVFPGIGHAFLGRWGRGAAFAAATLVPFWSTLVLGGLGLWLLPLIWVAAAVDAAWPRGGTQPTWGHRGLGAGVIFAELVLAGLLTRSLLVQAYKIPSGGMIPTLQVGDHILVSKLAKGDRGDVVVFPYPEQPGQDFVKRIVAVAGDTLELRHNQVVLNGVPQPRERAAEPCAYDDWDVEQQVWWRDVPCVLYHESIAGHAFVTMDLTRPRDVARRDFGPITVPDGEVYVLGDNRDDSHDSRYWGGVPWASIKGKAYLIWWSKGPDGVRWSRIGHSVH